MRKVCTRRATITKGLICTVLLISALRTHGQVSVDTQMWFDYNIVYPFLNVWTADAEFSYQTLVKGGAKWRSYQFTAGIQRNFTPRIDLFVSTPVYYTVQTPDYATLETRFSPALRFIYTSNRRIES